MATFADLHILPPLEDREACGRMAEVLRLGRYSTVGLTVPTGLLRDRIRPLREAFESIGVETVLRGDFSPPSRTELLKVLRNFRRAFDIVGVRCVNQRVATVACRDRRVDIVFFDTTNRNVRFTHSLARVLHGALELNFSDLMNQPEGWAFTKVRKAIAIAREHGVKVVLSSGARTPLMVRTPSELSALATTLGMKQDESTIAVSSLPLSIVATNVKKRAPEYVEEGVTIVVPTRRK